MKRKEAYEEVRWRALEMKDPCFSNWGGGGRIHQDGAEALPSREPGEGDAILKQAKLCASVKLSTEEGGGTSVAHWAYHFNRFWLT